MGTTPGTLRQVPLFATLPEPALEQVARAAIGREHSPGEIIVLQGCPSEAAYFVAAGQVRVFRVSPGGRMQVLARLGPGQTFNTVAPFLDRAENHASVEAVTPSAVWAVPNADFHRLVADIPELALAILHDFADRLDHLTDLVEDLSLRSVSGRLARFLLQHAESGAMPRGWTQDEIAAQLGTVRDSVGRSLRAFADRGLLRLDRQRIVLLDRERLEEEAQR